MVDEVQRYVSNNNLFSNKDKLLLAVSGGVDSVVLAHLLNKLKYKFAIAHCNFSLRGSESDADENLVQEIAKKLGVEIFIKSFDTAAHSQQEKISIQMAARDLRYAWFNQLVVKHNFHRIVTAHHHDDHVETILLNLMRGTGLAGLVGMPPRNGSKVRPLLSLAKDKILEYAQKNNLKWREDQTNTENKYHRNRIRNVVLPEMRRVNPNVSEALDQLSIVSSNARALLAQHVNDYRNLNLVKVGLDTEIELDEKKELNEFCLHEILPDFGFNHSQIENLVKGNEVGKVVVSEEYIANRDRQKIILSAVGDHKIENLIDIKHINKGSSELGWKFVKSSAADVEIIASPNFAFLDYDTLEFPLNVRNWKQGDWFIPLGMKGKKKVSDFMIDAKIPLNLKSRVLVMESGNNICWLAGHRIDNRFKITDATKKVLIVEIDPS